MTLPLFEESSSRTRFSTESAIQKLGANVINISSLKDTSINKGETIKESAILWSKYFDLLAIRSKSVFLPLFFSKYTSIPVINLGDGSNEHPTQGLATLVHIYEQFGKIEGLNVCLWGDFNKSRTMHSVAIVLGMLGANIYIYSIPQVAGTNSIVNKINSKCQSPKLTLVNSLEDIDKNLDVFYITRLQKERWNMEPQYEVFLPKYCDMLSTNGFILHPLPHNDEICDEVLYHKKSRIFEHIGITKQTRSWLIYSYKSAYENRKDGLTIL